MRTHINAEISAFFAAVEYVAYFGAGLNTACFVVCRRNVLFFHLRPKFSCVLIKRKTEGVSVVKVIMLYFLIVSGPPCSGSGVLSDCRSAARRHKTEVKASAKRYYVGFCAIVICYFSQNSVFHINQKSAYCGKSVKSVIPFKLDKILIAA